jgi:hypothetical protein
MAPAAAPTAAPLATSPAIAVVAVIAAQDTMILRPNTRIAAPNFIVNLRQWALTNKGNAVSGRFPYAKRMGRHRQAPEVFRKTGGLPKFALPVRADASPIKLARRESRLYPKNDKPIGNETD